MTLNVDLNSATSASVRVFADRMIEHNEMRLSRIFTRRATTSNDSIAGQQQREAGTGLLATQGANKTRKLELRQIQGPLGRRQKIRIRATQTSTVCTVRIVIHATETSKACTVRIVVRATQTSKACTVRIAVRATRETPLFHQLDCALVHHLHCRPAGSRHMVTSLQNA